jgi:hypothetical protein
VRIFKVEKWGRVYKDKNGNHIRVEWRDDP